MDDAINKNTRPSILTDASRRVREVFDAGLKAGSERSTADPERLLAIAMAAIDAVVGLSPSERGCLLSSMTHDESQFLHSVMLSMASRTINGGNENHVRYGVRAVLIERGRNDWRESVIMWVLLQHAAYSIDVAISPIYYEERHLGDDVIRRVCEANLRKGPICLEDYEWECVPFHGLLRYQPMR